MNAFWIFLFLLEITSYGKIGALSLFRWYSEFLDFHSPNEFKNYHEFFTKISIFNFHLISFLCSYFFFWIKLFWWKNICLLLATISFICRVVIALNVRFISNRSNEVVRLTFHWYTFYVWYCTFIYRIKKILFFLLNETIAGSALKSKEISLFAFKKTLRFLLKRLSSTFPFY